MFKSLVASTLVLAASVSMAEDAPQKPRELVKINGKPLTELHFALYQNQQGSSGQSTPQNQMVLLNQLINTTMLSGAAREEGLDKNEEVRTAMEVAENRVLAEAVIRNHLKNNPITDADIQKSYDAKYTNGSTKEYKARHILVETEDAAKDLIAKIAQGEDFSELAKAHSTGPSGPNGGDLGWFGPDQMVAPFSAATATLEKGQSTAEPVKTQFGWHVIQLDDIRDTPIPELADVKNTLLEELQREKAAAFMADVRKKTNIEIQPALQKPVTPDGTEAK